MAAAILAAVACGAHAQTIGLHLGSVHESPGFNGFNPGAYVRLDSGVTAGSYFNSIRKQSFYAGYTMNVWGPLDVTFAGVTGYQDYPIATAIPSVSVPLWKSVSARLAYVYSPGVSSAIHMTVEYAR